MQFFFKERSGERGGQEKPWQPMVFKNDAFFCIIQEQKKSGIVQHIFLVFLKHFW